MASTIHANARTTPRTLPAMESEAKAGSPR